MIGVQVGEHASIGVRRRGEGGDVDGGRMGARMRQEAGHPSQFTAWDFTVAWNQASESQGIGSPRGRQPESDFSLSQHRGSAFETKRNMRHINCLAVWPG